MKQKPKKKKEPPSNSPNWRNRKVPLPGIAKIKEEPPMIMDIERIVETSEESTELTQTSINVLAQLEMDNSPLEELWINAKTNISQKLELWKRKRKHRKKWYPQTYLIIRMSSTK